MIRTENKPETNGKVHADVFAEKLAALKPKPTAWEMKTARVQPHMTAIWLKKDMRCSWKQLAAEMSDESLKISAAELQEIMLGVTGKRDTKKFPIVIPPKIRKQKAKKK